ncbi:hypothetical protein RIF29_28034 [Crotalaria pallida]|uniref:Uncharacterized protein n=1 Tax=Crotalaria pallida TaxID=3830 RepID=A0AAN9I666_CROPI
MAGNFYWIKVGLVKGCVYIQEETPFRYASIWALPLCKAEKPPPPLLNFTYKFPKPHPNSPSPNFPQPYSHSNRRRRRHRCSCTFPISLLHWVLGFGLKLLLCEAIVAYIDRCIANQVCEVPNTQLIGH